MEILFFHFFVFVTFGCGSLCGIVLFEASPGSEKQHRASDDAVLGQLVQLQVIEGLPGANDSDVCKTKKDIKRGTGGRLRSQRSTLKSAHLCLSPPFLGCHPRI